MALGQSRRGRREDFLNAAVFNGLLAMKDAASEVLPVSGSGCRMLGPGRLLVSCVSVPAQAENSPQDPIRAGGRAGGQRSGPSRGNARESMGCGCDGGGPPFTLSPEIAGSELSSLPSLVCARPRSAISRPQAGTAGLEQRLRPARAVLRTADLATRPGKGDPLDASRFQCRQHALRSKRQPAHP